MVQVVLSSSLEDKVIQLLPEYSKYSLRKTILPMSVGLSMPLFIFPATYSYFSTSE
jgi:hypothetical protein